jgi:imidazolonepropionase-like amidohydrolase
MPRLATSLLLHAACSSGGDPLAPPIDNAPAEPTLGVFVIRDVAVVDVVNGRVTSGQSVLLRNSRIEAVGPDGSFTAPAEARVITASGHYLMPGLIDMHIHARASEITRYPAYGVTAARNMWGYSTLPTLINRIATREVRGPLIFSASPGLDAPPGVWPETRFITDSTTADHAVTDFAAAGWKFIKVYNQVSAADYGVILRRAAALGIRVIGHTPFAVSLESALEQGHASFEHLNGYERGLGGWGGLNLAGVAPRIQATVDAGAFNCPTLAILTRLSDGAANEDRIVSDRRRVAGDLYRAGARLLIGTDAGIDVTPAGSSIFEELEEFRTIGVPIPAILRIATHDAARFLGARDSLGAVAQGMRAELLLLDANPLNSLDALRDPVAVVLAGEWLPRTWLRNNR